MMPKLVKQSAGILLFRYDDGEIKFFLVHPGGPFWKNKDVGSWSIPKGEFSDNEQPLVAAIREFNEETGFVIKGEFIELQPVEMKSGKIIYAWACEHNIDHRAVDSNTFQMEWPPKSGTLKNFPEIDRAEWFTAEEAQTKINDAQAGFITQILKKLQA